MLNIIKAFLLLINAVIIIALLAIHFIFKEDSYQSSLLFYTFPLPVIILMVLFLSILIRRKYKKYNLVLAFILLIIWMGRSFKIHFSEDINNTDLEVVFWNASHDRNFQDAFNENENIPDVVVLVEYHGDFLNETKAKYSNYHFYKHPIKEIGIFSKNPIYILGVNSSKFGTAIINFNTYDTNFYAVDVTASLDVPKAWGLEFVDKAITQTDNTIILGDFNVPYESKYLNTIKADFNFAFNEKGNGFRETWFWNIPLLSLDHIWVSKDLEILKTEKINTFKSDHSMLRTVIRE